MSTILFEKGKLHCISEMINESKKFKVILNISLRDFPTKITQNKCHMYSLPSGGIDEMLMHIIQLCNDYNVTMVYALNRRKMGGILRKKSSC